MPITEYPFNEKRLNKTGLLFSDKTEEDPWVLYHGTSSIAEEKIEAKGLTSLSPSYSIEEVKEVLAIFDGLYWKGSGNYSAAGYSVLKSYSKDFDYNSDGSKKIFFHPTISFVHCSEDFAGGETSRALRYCFKDLGNYLANPENRKSSILRRCKDIHDSLGGIETILPPELLNLKEQVSVDDLMSLIEFLQKKLPRPEHWNNYRPSDSRLRVPDDAEWVKLGLERTKSIEKRCLATTADFRYGVIYAVKFAEADLEILKDGGTMAIYTSEPVNPKKIIEKVKIPIGFKGQPPGSPCKFWDRQRAQGNASEILNRMKCQ